MEGGVFRTIVHPSYNSFLLVTRQWTTTWRTRSRWSSWRKTRVGGVVVDAVVVVMMGDG